MCFFLFYYNEKDITKDTTRYNIINNTIKGRNIIELIKKTIVTINSENAQLK